MSFITNVKNAVDEGNQTLKGLKNGAEQVNQIVDSSSKTNNIIKNEIKELYNDGKSGLNTLKKDGKKILNGFKEVVTSDSKIYNDINKYVTENFFTEKYDKKTKKLYLEFTSNVLKQHLLQGTSHFVDTNNQKKLAAFIIQYLKQIKISGELFKQYQSFLSEPEFIDVMQSLVGDYINQNDMSENDERYQKLVKRLLVTKEEVENQNIEEEIQIEEIDMNDDIDSDEEKETFFDLLKKTYFFKEVRDSENDSEIEDKSLYEDRINNITKSLKEENTKKIIKTSVISGVVVGGGGGVVLGFGGGVGGGVVGGLAGIPFGPVGIGVGILVGVALGGFILGAGGLLIGGSIGALAGAGVVYLTFETLKKGLIEKGLYNDFVKNIGNDPNLKKYICPLSSTKNPELVLFPVKIGERWYQIQHLTDSKMRKKVIENEKKFNNIIDEENIKSLRLDDMALRDIASHIREFAKTWGGGNNDGILASMAYIDKIFTDECKKIFSKERNRLIKLNVDEEVIDYVMKLYKMTYGQMDIKHCLSFCSSLVEFQPEDKQEDWRNLLNHLKSEFNRINKEINDDSISEKKAKNILILERKREFYELLIGVAVHMHLEKEKGEE